MAETPYRLTNVIRCARCGQDHPSEAEPREIEFKRFRRPIRENDGTIWTHWGLCPVTGEPVLLLMRETSDG